MTKELRQIIEKLVSDNPDIEKITASWDQCTCSGLIWVYIPNIKGTPRYHSFQDEYWEWLDTTFSEYPDSVISILPVDATEPAESEFKLVYTKESGVIENAI